MLSSLTKHMNTSCQSKNVIHLKRKSIGEVNGDFKYIYEQINVYTKGKSRHLMYSVHTRI